MTQAATVSGATPASTKNSTAGTPSRSRASSCNTAPGLVRSFCVLDIYKPPGFLVVISGRSGAVAQHGAVDGRLGLGDQLPQPGIEPRRRLVRAVAGSGRVLGQAEPQAAPGRQPGQHRPVSRLGPARVQCGPAPAAAGKTPSPGPPAPSARAAVPGSAPGSRSVPAARPPAPRRSGPGTAAIPAPGKVHAPRRSGPAPAGPARPRAGPARPLPRRHVAS